MQSITMLSYFCCSGSFKHSICARAESHQMYRKYYVLSQKHFQLDFSMYNIANSRTRNNRHKAMENGEFLDEFKAVSTPNYITDDDRT